MRFLGHKYKRKDLKDFEKMVESAAPGEIVTRHGKTVIRKRKLGARGKGPLKEVLVKIFRWFS